jgi:predicted DsbA family dithiol-disulfide isomerase
MEENPKIIIELFYNLTCPNCRLLKHILDEIMPQYKAKFKLKKRLTSSPIGFYRSLKLGIHAVPTLLIDNKIVYKEVPPKEELIETLNSYLK